MQQFLDEEVYQHYCSLISPCREGTAWLLRPACVRYLAQPPKIDEELNILIINGDVMFSASTTRAAGAKTKR